MTEMKSKDKDMIREIMEDNPSIFATLNGVGEDYSTILTIFNEKIIFNDITADGSFSLNVNDVHNGNHTLYREDLIELYNLLGKILFKKEGMHDAFCDIIKEVI